MFGGPFNEQMEIYGNIYIFASIYFHSGFSSSRHFASNPTTSFRQDGQIGILTQMRDLHKIPLRNVYDIQSSEGS